MSRSEKILLGVNIDHIATLRQARGTKYPDPVEAAIAAERAGADGITIHLREDRRHIQERDLRLLSEVVQTRINLEMAVTDEMLSIAEQYKPSDVCLVPEKREELTTEGGLDVAGQQSRISEAVARLTEAGIRVSLFIDAEPEQIEASREARAPVIEIHTGHFADAVTKSEHTSELGRIINGVQLGDELGLQVNAGHGLNYHNTAVIAAIPQVVELNIGHAIIARALFDGMENAVALMKKIMVEARS